MPQKSRRFGSRQITWKDSISEMRKRAVGERFANQKLLDSARVQQEMANHKQWILGSSLKSINSSINLDLVSDIEKSYLAYFASKDIQTARMAITDEILLLMNVIQQASEDQLSMVFNRLEDAYFEIGSAIFSEGSLGHDDMGFREIGKLASQPQRVFAKRQFKILYTYLFSAEEIANDGLEDAIEYFSDDTRGFRFGKKLT